MTKLFAFFLIILKSPLHCVRDIDRMKKIEKVRGKERDREKKRERVRER